MVWNAVKPFGDPPPSRSNFTFTLISPAQTAESCTTTAPASGFDELDGSIEAFEDPPSTDITDSSGGENDRPISTPDAEAAACVCSPMPSGLAVKTDQHLPPTSGLMPAPASPVKLLGSPARIRSPGRFTPDLTGATTPSRRSILTPKRTSATPLLSPDR